MKYGETFNGYTLLLQSAVMKIKTEKSDLFAD